MDCYKCGKRLRRGQTMDDCQECYPRSLVIGMSRQKYDREALELKAEIQSFKREGDAHPYGLTPGHRFYGLSILGWTLKLSRRTVFCGLGLRVDPGGGYDGVSVRELASRLKGIVPVERAVSAAITADPFGDAEDAFAAAIEALIDATGVERVYLRGSEAGSRWDAQPWTSIPVKATGAFIREYGAYLLARHGEQDGTVSPAEWEAEYGTVPV